MKKGLIALMFFVWVFAGCIAQSKDDIKVFFIDSQGERLFIDKESFYDIEEKTTVYYIDNQDIKSIYIVEIYRIIDSKEHFYRSFSLSQSDFGSGFDVGGVFSDLTSPFIVSSAFIIRICRTDKQHYLKLKSREQCGLSVEYKILKSQ
jgi:hypothetical protein